METPKMKWMIWGKPFFWTPPHLTACSCLRATIECNINRRINAISKIIIDGSYKLYQNNGFIIGFPTVWNSRDYWINVFGDWKDGTCRALQALRPVLFAADRFGGMVFDVTFPSPFLTNTTEILIFSRTMRAPLSSNLFWRIWMVGPWRTSYYLFVNSLFFTVLLGLLPTVFQFFAGSTTDFLSWQSNSIQIRNSDILLLASYVQSFVVEMMVNYSCSHF